MGASPSETKHDTWAAWPAKIGSSNENGTIRGGTDMEIVEIIKRRYLWSEYETRMMWMQGDKRE